MYNIIYSLLGKQRINKQKYERKIDMKGYLNRRGTHINIGFTYTNNTPILVITMYSIHCTLYIVQPILVLVFVNKYGSIFI